ncbi:hypothetical protein CGLO_14265 [Colletotrichum gloeosporioides Cg-14]|uniref:Uncharacterized protein n=1 Tax=Colletotrichum gloeosporioides (strain Cg-14) TaxID=1237896 RepID=T0LE57_COLGC|nr:hypothetical protein CGLO_14265 [Colletotrichum gloeosporioides Cg-14]
MRITNKMSTS